MDPFSASVIGISVTKGAASALGSSLVRSLLPRLKDPWTIHRFRKEFSSQLIELGINGTQREHLEQLFHHHPLVGQLSLLQTPQQVHTMVSGQMVGYLAYERILVTRAIFTAINIAIQPGPSERFSAGMILELYLIQYWPEYREMLEAERRRREHPGVDEVKALREILTAAGQVNAALKVEGNGNLSLTGPMKLNMQLSDPHALQMQQWLRGGSIGTLVLHPQEGHSRLSLGSKEIDALMGINNNPNHQVLAFAAEPEYREVKVEIKGADGKTRFTKCTLVADRANRIITLTFGNPDLFSLSLTRSETEGKVKFQVDLGNKPLAIAYKTLLLDFLKLCEPSMQLFITGLPEPIISGHELWGGQSELRTTVWQATRYHLMYIDILEHAQNDGQDITEVKLSDSLDEKGFAALTGIARAVRKEAASYSTSMLLTSENLKLIEHRALVQLGIEIYFAIDFGPFTIEAQDELNDPTFEIGEQQEDGQTLVHISGKSPILNLKYSQNDQVSVGNEQKSEG